MKKSTTPPTAAAMVVPRLDKDNKKKRFNRARILLSQILSSKKVAHPVLVSTGQPLSSITVQLKKNALGRKSFSLVVCACACTRDAHSRQRAVGVAWQTVSCSITVLPHSLVVFLHTTGAMIHTEISILEVSALYTMLCSLRTFIRMKWDW